MVQDLKRHFSKKDTQIANRHLKRCSSSLIMREIQIKTITRHHLASLRMAIIKKNTNHKRRHARGERDSPILLLGVKLAQPLWKPVWRFLKKIQVKLPYNPGNHSRVSNRKGEKKKKNR